MRIADDTVPGRSVNFAGVTSATVGKFNPGQPQVAPRQIVRNLYDQAEPIFAQTGTLEGMNMRQTLRSWSFRPLQSLLAAVLIVGFAAGQPAQAVERTEDDLQPFRTDGIDPAAHGLAPQPLVLPALGLAMYVPPAHITTDRAGGLLVVSLHDRSAAPAWSITIQHMQTQPGATPEGQVQQHIDALTAAGRRHEVMENRDITAGNSAGRLCFIRQATGIDGDDSIIAGWLILPAGSDVMLVLSILAMPEALPFLRPQLDASFQTINLRPVAELSLQRRSRMESGRRLLASFTPERLQSLLGTHQWSRIYRTDREGNEYEIGYTLLEVYEAKRGALNPDRAESAYSVSDRELGLMVRLQGRVIGDAQRGVFFDSVALYWMAWDQSEEAWTVRGTQRQGRAERSEAETGLLLPASVSNPQARLRVSRVRTGDYESTPAEWSLPDVYLPQALAAVLGRLLPREENQAVSEFAYYFYNFAQATPRLTQRTDRWERSEDGHWILTTNLTVDAPPIISTYSASGQFLHTRRADGTTTVPMSIERIRQIWIRQGLPLGE